MLQLEFTERLPFPHKLCGALKCFAGNAIHDFAGFQMAGQLFGVPARLEFLHQIGGADDFLLHLADQFDGPGVDQPDVGNIIFGRILHGDGFAARKNFGQHFVQLFPSGVLKSLAGERLERAGFDFVH